LVAATANTASALVQRDGSGNFSAGTVTATSINGTTVNIAGNGAGADPYGTIAITEPAGAPNYSYYGLTRAGQLGAGFGLTGTNGALGFGTNAFWFGNATAGSAGVMSTAWIAFNSSAFVANGTVSGTRLISTVATGTAPFTVTSTTAVANLSIGGNAATASNASLLNSISAVNLFNNMGQTHPTYTSFNAQGTALSADFGYRFVQGNANGPGTNGAAQYYAWNIGLGSDYAFNTYAAQFAIGRNVTTPYLSVRYEEASVLGAWQKISAGFADTAGNVTGTVAIANGGTGQTSATAAFNALNPMTTAGDIIYESSPTVAARLGIGSTGQVLTVSGGLPAWAAAPSGGQFFGTAAVKAIAYNANTIGENITVTTGNNGLSAGPITISSGFTVTVQTGAVWVIV
jgi:hypothetical protein